MFDAFGCWKVVMLRYCQKLLEQLLMEAPVLFFSSLRTEAFTDQSHFIRSFKEFAGISPNQYQKQYTELVENFPEMKS